MFLRAGLAALAMCLATSAHAGLSEDFAACDGRLKPKSKDDGMRGEAQVSRFRSVGLGNGAAATVSACTKVLGDKALLPTQTLRRAHLLRARAAAQIELGKPDEAVADLDAAEAAVADRSADPFFQRSMGVSLQMLRALALAQQGKFDEAAALAEAAAARRPFALQVQLAGAAVRDAALFGGEGQHSASDWLLRLEPSARTSLITRKVARGDFPEALRYAAMGGIALPEPVTQPTGKPNIANALAMLQASTQAEMAAILGVLSLAHAQAASGDIAAAGQGLDAVARHLADPAPPAAPNPPAAEAADGAGLPPEVKPAPPATSAKALLRNLFAPLQARAEARIALAEGRLDDVRKALEGRLPADAATAELIDSFVAASADDADLTRFSAASARMRERARTGETDGLRQAAETLLIAPESARAVIDYERSRPNILGALIGGALTMGTSLLGGIDRTAGFRSKDNADGTVTIEFTGNTTSAPMVQEMTLLRAAELTRASGKPQFAIISRKDYQQFLAQMQYGMEISRTPTGYKTEMTVRFLDEGTGGSIDAVQVIDALGPLYYQS